MYASHASLKLSCTLRGLHLGCAVVSTKPSSPFKYLIYNVAVLKMGDKQDKQESGEKRDKKKKEPKIYQVPPISERKYLRDAEGKIILQW